MFAARKYYAGWIPGLARHPKGGISSKKRTCRPYIQAIIGKTKTPRPAGETPKGPQSELCHVKLTLLLPSKNKKTARLVTKCFNGDWNFPCWRPGWNVLLISISELCPIAITNIFVLSTISHEKSREKLRNPSKICVKTKKNWVETT